MSTSITAERNENVHLYRVLAAHPEMMAKGLTPDQAKVMQEHLDHLKSLEAKRVIVIAGRTLNNDETTFGIVMFRADTAAARDIMNSDPGIQKGLFKGTLFPFQITARESHEV
jgi:uncharacterized protein YciI